MGREPTHLDIISRQLAGALKENVRLRKQIEKLETRIIEMERELENLGYELKNRILDHGI